MSLTSYQQELDQIVEQVLATKIITFTEDELLEDGTKHIKIVQIP